ncbi:MAG: antibiotic biosynthesis monooxygenase [Gemmatimonadaceae bacterium]|nr:antibiotic biosynthesis monooxygenase [Gemmatimonadaceae bacterium]
MITLTARFTIRPGRIPAALKLVHAVKAQSDAEQPGTLLYLVHRVLDKHHQPTRELLFYECYRDQKALDTHLKSSTWKALTRRWESCFEGTPAEIAVTPLDRIAGFVHLEAP